MIDTPSNTQIVYLFVNDFKWSHDSDKENAVGNPKPKRLYRAVKNIDTNSYRIVYNIEGEIQAVHIANLKSNKEEDGYVADIVEVNLNNVLDFDLSESDVDSFLKWLDTNNEDLKQWMFPSKKTTLPPGALITIPNSREEFVQQVIKVVRSRDGELGSIISTVHELRKASPIMYGTIGKLINAFLSEKENTIVNEIRIDRTHGAGANISYAIDKLNRYLGPNRRNNLDESDLTGAIKDLLLELYRRHLNNIS